MGELILLTTKAAAAVVETAALPPPPPLPSPTITLVLRSYFVFSFVLREVRKLVLVFILFHIGKWAAKCVTNFLRGCNISL